ncbi:hypothetical protein Hanom_Chr04g00371281 [Helianthus anomalus]
MNQHTNQTIFNTQHNTTMACASFRVPVAVFSGGGSNQGVRVFQRRRLEPGL